MLPIEEKRKILFNNYLVIKKTALTSINCSLLHEYIYTFFDSSKKSEQTFDEQIPDSIGKCYTLALAVYLSELISIIINEKADSLKKFDFWHHNFVITFLLSTFNNRFSTIGAIALFLNNSPTPIIYFSYLQKLLGNWSSSLFFYFIYLFTFLYMRLWMTGRLIFDTYK